MFVNCSNHQSALWNDLQRKEAEKYGEIIDVKFPAVPAEAIEEEIQDLAQNKVKQILSMKPQAVMCQGEFTLTYSIVKGIDVFFL